jgi:hypothetical protein
LVGESLAGLLKADPAEATDFASTGTFVSAVCFDAAPTAADAADGVSGVCGMAGVPAG